MTTHILPNLVIKLVENNLIVGDIVVPKNISRFWTRWVHMLHVSKAQRVRAKAKGVLGRRVVAPRVFDKKRSRPHSLTAYETSIGIMPSRPIPEGALPRVTN